MLDELNSQARSLYDAGEFTHALADYSVLREIRSRREGPYSVKYLAALHDCVRCMSQLHLWSDSDLLCSELHAKYVRTHGRGGADTVDVARHWAWAMVHLDQADHVAALCLTTADAMWDADLPGADRLLGAAAAQSTRSAELAETGLIDGVALRHTADVVASLNRWNGLLTSDAAARTSATESLAPA
ncbi:hypothetical protein nbrc107696_19870 [Gordonia spumicola]|uniref:Uncharacterized protein n=1 Tax=Gordonia spumicola TaxID=589161 RepID=A0A7I9V8U8_9ACTN|nr:hypothetical protein [Gordonia spumicola]GEE01541.1 hypothetical protein nbrc107696_19870 [Gordonia spumicola]